MHYPDNHSNVVSEKDPYGKAPGESGAKLDQGKVRPSLVLGAFARALLKISEVGTYGANKYSDHGWLTVPDGQRRYANAAWRHLLKRAAGEEFDPESGLDHLAHQAWNVLAELELKLREKDGE